MRDDSRHAPLQDGRMEDFTDDDPEARFRLFRRLLVVAEEEMVRRRLK